MLGTGTKVTPWRKLWLGLVQSSLELVPPIAIPMVAMFHVEATLLILGGYSTSIATGSQVALMDQRQKGFYGITPEFFFQVFPLTTLFLNSQSRSSRR